MSVLEAIGLGVLQGATEFLPVSSSGHLTLAERVLGMKMDSGAIALDVMLHAATLSALAVYFGRAWVRRLRAEPRLLALVLVACLPAGAAYFSAERLVELAKGSLAAVGAAFVAAGGYIVFASLFAAHRTGSGAVGEGAETGGRPLVPGGRSAYAKALLVGAGQAVALLPGVSRSGTTIGTGLLVGLDRGAAFEFSFLIGAPVMLGALLVKIGDIGVIFAASPAAAAGGFLAAFAAGFASLMVLRKVLARRKLWAFGAYTTALGVVCLGLAIGGTS
jgi:undecaprenyl-diphosphatase